MQISSTQSGAAAYAFKKALELPEPVLNLVKQSSLANQPLQASERPDTVSGTKEKGSIIDIIA